MSNRKKLLAVLKFYAFYAYSIPYSTLLVLSLVMMFLVVNAISWEFFAFILSKIIINALRCCDKNDLVQYNFLESVEIFDITVKNLAVSTFEYCHFDKKLSRNIFAIMPRPNYPSALKKNMSWLLFYSPWIILEWQLNQKEILFRQNLYCAKNNKRFKRKFHTILIVWSCCEFLSMGWL